MADDLLRVTQLATAAIPSSGERIPRVGLGTWQTFDAGSDRARLARLAETLRAFAEGGGTVLDTSPMYGSAERVLGDLVAETGLRERLFLATKVWTSGRARGETQMLESMALLRTRRVELMQIHNLLDWRTHLATLRAWKERGTFRYIGITHYARGAREELMRVLRAERVDFVQFALSLDEPDAARDLLPLCAERGVAFLANRPFGEGSALARVRNVPLPPVAADAGVTSWAQYLLAWTLSHAEVTCAIPGTSRPEHVRENLAVARRPLPDAALRARMATAWRAR
jgi:diketogulonate reductase-like aldo/keto reductase